MRQGNDELYQARRANRVPARRVGTEHPPGCEEFLRKEAYIEVRRIDERCSATQHPDFLRNHQIYFASNCGFNPGNKSKIFQNYLFYLTFSNHSGPIIPSMRVKGSGSKNEALRQRPYRLNPPQTSIKIEKVGIPL
jgi:hypothetical protein